MRFGNSQSRKRIAIAATAGIALSLISQGTSRAEITTRSLGIVVETATAESLRVIKPWKYQSNTVFDLKEEIRLSLPIGVTYQGVFLNGTDLKLKKIDGNFILLPTIIGPSDDVVVKTSVKNIAVKRSHERILLASINFDQGSAKLTSSAKTAADKAIRLIRTKGFRFVSLYGHTDSKAKENPDANQDLSHLRAAAVYDYLSRDNALGGIATIWRDGQGAHEPIASNLTAAGRALNRRVEIWVS